MNGVQIIKLIIVFSLINFSAFAQKKKKQSNDSLTIYREFVQLGKLYLNVPLQINLHFVHRTTPVIEDEDSVETDMLLYYGKNDFYMQAEGMEQIANDTMVIMVNNEAKMIKLYPNSDQLMKNLEKTVSVFMPDSSLQKLVRQYTARIQDEEKNIKQIILQSRDKIFGTDLAKEMISIIYHADTYEPLTYDQRKLSLQPIDSIVYNQLIADTAYAGRLVNTHTDAGNLFFIVKEKNVQCRFTKISREQHTPPAREQDRVLRIVNGEYQPAKGFEDYLVSKEF